MSDSLLQKLKKVCDAFRIPGTLLRCEEIKQGNVNRTYRVFFLQEDGSEKSYKIGRAHV